MFLMKIKVDRYQFKNLKTRYLILILKTKKKIVFYNN